MATSDQNFAKFRNSLKQPEDSYLEKEEGVKKIEMETQKNVEEKIRSILSSKEKQSDILQKKDSSGPSKDPE